MQLIIFPCHQSYIANDYNRVHAQRRLVWISSKNETRVSKLSTLHVQFVYSPGQLVHADVPPLLLSFCRQICLGMTYLAGKAFVHRDLATRNILVSANNICKV